MSKTKAKRARRESKREETRKQASQAKRAAKPSSSTPSKPNPNARTPTSTPKMKTGLKGKEIREEVRKRKREEEATKGTEMGSAKKAKVQASQKHEVPFGVYDRILLVGEGDFSMTRCLAEEFGCANVTGTSFDSEEEVREKYPTFPTIHQSLTSLTPPVPLHHSIDATKLSTYKSLKPSPTEPWDTIAFLFPHVGGLSTDVNRQVRSNQSLLVSFFKSALEIPSTPSSGLSTFSSTRANTNPRPFLKMGGRIIVTLFEGEPYTLWNIRDLARHCGLKVVESFKFDWGQYPGYGHVRTLGSIEGGGAWRGEEREARMYVFEKVPLEADSEEEEREKKKRKRVRLEAMRKREREGSGSDGE